MKKYFIKDRLENLYRRILLPIAVVFIMIYIAHFVISKVMLFVALWGGFNFTSFIIGMCTTAVLWFLDSTTQ